ncbi:MAG: hypothetical protein HOV68_06760 [Streptomycetaceae bacterium]|nr:hypothetical protein [Streptomycetaceae bacterium]
MTFVTGCGSDGADVLGAGSGSPSATGDAPKGSGGPHTSPAPKPPNGKPVEDSKAHISYVLPAGWTPTDDLLAYFTSGAQRGPGSSASPTGDTSSSGDGADSGSFLVGLLDSGMFASQERDKQAAAHALARQFAEFFYPNEAQDVTKDDKAVKVDGRDAWYTEVECVPASADDKPFRLRVTVVDTGRTPVYTLGLANSGGSTPLAEIDGINGSVRFT